MWVKQREQQEGEGVLGRDDEGDRKGRRPLMRGERKGRDQGRVASSRESRRRRRSGPPFPVARGLAGFGDAEPRVGSVRGSGPGPLLVETFPLFFFSFFF